MASRNPFSVSQAELDSLKASLDGLAAEYVAPLNTLGEAFGRALKAFGAVPRSEPETRDALRELARLIEASDLAEALRARQGHEFWEQMGKETARIVVQPAIGSDPAAKRQPSKVGREYAEAGYSLNQLLDAATWADGPAAEAHFAVLMSGRLAWWELHECRSALVGALRRRTLPDFAPRFEAMTAGNLAWPELREADPFGELEKFALEDWREWLKVRDAYRPAGINECLSLGTMPRFAAEPDAPPEVPAAPTDPPDGPGFPHPENYLPEGMNNAVADTWPMARRQLGAFWDSLEVANCKLSEIDARLPHGFAAWWVRSWADALLFRSHRFVGDAAGVRAWYEFGRVVDRALFISSTPGESPHPYDAEFTYYAQPLQVDGGRGPRPAPFDTHGLSGESSGRTRPVPFPRSPVPPPNLDPRLSCMEFRVWAGFLASPEPLTPQQVEELGHVGYSAVGYNGWCRVSGTHGEQCSALGVRVSNRLRETIRRVSDALDIGVETIPQDGRLDDTLDRVTNWLVRARAAEATQSVPTRTTECNTGKLNAMEAEQEPQPHPPAQPNWNAKERVLTFGTWRFEYGKSAPSQEKILAAFQAANWPSALREYLPHNLGSILQNMRNKLGTECPISFDGDGACGVRWQPKRPVRM